MRGRRFASDLSKCDVNGYEGLGCSMDEDISEMRMIK